MKKAPGSEIAQCEHATCDLAHRCCFIASEASLVDINFCLNDLRYFKCYAFRHAPVKVFSSGQALTDELLYPSNSCSLKWNLPSLPP